MAITYSAADGMRFTTPAKNGFLGMQTGLPNNRIAFDTDINTNNGNLMASPTLTGRLVIVRRGEANEETRYLISDAGGTTGTVHEPWVEPPVTGSTYDISYIVEDAATTAGATLLSKRTRDYSLSNMTTVGNDPTGTFSWFALLDGASLESDDKIALGDRAFQIEGDGMFSMGYEAGGAPVPGGYIVFVTDGAPDYQWEVVGGGRAQLYQAFMTSVQVGYFQFLDQSRVDINGFQVYKTLYDCKLESEGVFRNVILQGTLDANDNIEIDDGFASDGITLIATLGFYPNGVTTGSVLGYQSLQNTQDVQLLTQGMLLSFINPIWDGDDPTLTWTAATGTIEERFEYISQVSSPAGAPRPNARIYLLDQYDSDFQIQTASADPTGTYSDDILTRAWYSGTAGSVPTQVRGGFTQRLVRYGQNPFEAALSVDARIDQVVTLVDDAGIEISEAAADNVSGTHVTEHSPNPGTLLAYDAGSSLFVENEIVTGTTSGGVGTVVEVIGDQTSGYLFMDGRNVTPFQDNESLVGHLGGAATADAATINTDFTWEVGCNQNSLSDVYAWLASQIAKASPVSWVIEMLRHRVQLLLRSGADFSTEAVDSEGVFISDRGAGNVTEMVADDGTTFTPPTTYTITLTSINTNSEVRIYNDVAGEPGAELAGTESSGDTFQYSYTHSGSDIPVIIVIFHLDWLPIRLFLDLTAADSSIPIQQITDRVYANP